MKRLLGSITRASLWVAILAATSIVVILATSTWQRHRPAVATTIPVLEQESFCVDVLNGNGRRGEARIVASFLRQEGFHVEEITNAERFDHPRTLVIDRRDHPERARSVAEALGGVPIVLQRGEGTACELTVLLGHDWSLDPRWEERQDEWDR